MKTILFAPETMNIAETTRMIEIARAGRDLFHSVFLGYGGGFAHLIEEAGFPFHLLEPHLTPQRVEELMKADRMEWGGRFFTADELIMRAKNELALYEQVNPAAVVIGFTMSTLISTRGAGIPLVYVMPFSLTRPFFEAAPDIWGTVLDYGIWRLVPKPWLNRLINHLGLTLGMWAKSMNKAAQYFDLPPFSRLLDLMEGDYNLVTDIPALTGVAQLPPNWQYIGPVFARLDGDVPLQIRELPRDKPLIYFAMGSSANRKVLLEVLGMFEGLPYTVIAPIKAHLAGGDVRVPGNVHVFDWLPAHKVNPLADTAVIHGGQGTVQTACVSGTPFVGIGLQPEQDINIELVARYGTAVRLPKYRVTREKLQANIEYLLHDRQVRQRARALQETMRSWDGPSKAARFLVDTFGDAHDV